MNTPSENETIVVIGIAAPMATLASTDAALEFFNTGASDVSVACDDEDSDSNGSDEVVDDVMADLGLAVEALKIVVFGGTGEHLSPRKDIKDTTAE